MASKPYLNQDFKDIKAECLRTGKLFTDPLFPPCDKSINIKNKVTDHKTRWIRAKNLSSNPYFIVDGIGRDDLDQGFFI